MSSSNSRFKHHRNRRRGKFGDSTGDGDLGDDGEPGGVLCAVCRRRPGTVQAALGGPEVAEQCGDEDEYELSFLACVGCAAEIPLLINRIGMSAIVARIIASYAPCQPRDA